jgi:thymidylate synthase (FAD)
MMQSVRLVSFSKSSEDFSEELKDCQDLISFCARVSNPSNQLNTKTTEKLLEYMIKNKHWSPFEMASACLEITTTRDIGRQILRHRSFSFQEFSQRYADPTKDLSFETREARFQDPKNRQNSIELNIEEDRRLNEDFRMKQMLVWRRAQDTYEWAISKGIAKEQARAVLPEGMTVSRLYMNGTLRSWVHYIDLRSANGTQKEHQDIAIACAREIAKIFPLMTDISNV